MRFILVDRILDLVPGKSAVAEKSLSPDEELFRDHFPEFPVLPGVMMIEAATQAAGWLMHRRSGFACSMAVLKEARNVKYGQFVAPGDTLCIRADLQRTTDAGAVFKITDLESGNGTRVNGKKNSFFVFS